jgi:hypothetical protein
MYRPILMVVFLLGLCGVCSGQSPTADSQTLRSILTELQQLRQELRASTAAFQKSQILLRHWQVQREAVSLAAQRSNEARVKLTEAQSRQAHFSAEIKRFETELDRVQNDVEKKQMEDVIARMKSERELAGNEEQQVQSRAAETEERCASSKQN